MPQPEKVRELADAFISYRSVFSVVFSDVKNGFSIFGFDDTIVLDDEEKSATVAVGDPFSMTCGASNINYTNIRWQFNGEPIDSNDGKLF